ncbi:hypothetical protein GCM10027447_07520 [Glycomyces halotolerans]
MVGVGRDHRHGAGGECRGRAEGDEDPARGSAAGGWAVSHWLCLSGEGEKIGWNAPTPKIDELQCIGKGSAVAA